MIGDRLRFFCERRLYCDDFALHIATGEPVTAVAKEVVFEECDPRLASAPALTLGHRAAQELIDELWRAGLRPTQGKQSEGVTAAQARHLEDMRAIAFAKLKVETP